MVKKTQSNIVFDKKRRDNSQTITSSTTYHRTMIYTRFKTNFRSATI